MSADGPAHPPLAKTISSEIGTNRVEVTEPINPYIGGWPEECSDHRRRPVSRRRTALLPPGDDLTLGSFRNLAASSSRGRHVDVHRERKRRGLTGPGRLLALQLVQGFVETPLQRHLVAREL